LPFSSFLFTWNSTRVYFFLAHILVHGP
jgi:hypothetical protein